MHHGLVHLHSNHSESLVLLRGTVLGESLVLLQARARGLNIEVGQRNALDHIHRGSVIRVHKRVSTTNKELLVTTVLLADRHDARRELSNGGDVARQKHHVSTVRRYKHALHGLVVKQRTLRRRQTQLERAFSSRSLSRKQSSGGGNKCSTHN